MGNTDANDGNIELFSFGSPMYYGSGCPIDSVETTKQDEALTVLFSKFGSTTEGSKSKNVKTSCNLGIPVKVKKGNSVTIYRAEYTFAGQKGPKIKKTFKKTEEIYIDQEFRVV